MNRKPGFPSSSCSIKLPDGTSLKEDDSNNVCSDPEVNYKKRQQLISFGHNQWGFKNWNWTVTKQDLDFIDFSDGKYSAGVVAFVSVTIKAIGIHREDVGYATSVANQKGSAIHNARKSSITNALRETLLSFGGHIANQLIEQLAISKTDDNKTINDNTVDKNLNSSHRNVRLPNNLSEPKNANLGNSHIQQNNPYHKDSSDSSGSSEGNQNKDARSPQPHNNQHQVNNQQQLSNSSNRPKPQLIPPEIPSYPANRAPVKSNFLAPNHLGKVATGAPPATGPVAPAIVHPSNVYQQEVAMEVNGLTEEEVRAERKRRQRQKQEEFRIKQVHRGNPNLPLS